MILRSRRTSLCSILFGLVIYLLFLGQEILLNQVWCHKFDGTRDLEFALMGTTCSCPHTHGNDSLSGHTVPSEGIVESFPGDTSCLNIPLNNSRQSRVRSDASPDIGGPPWSGVSGDESVGFHTVNFYCWNIFKLSKFLLRSDSSVLLNIMRC